MGLQVSPHACLLSDIMCSLFMFIFPFDLTLCNLYSRSRVIVNPYTVLAHLSIPVKYHSSAFLLLTYFHMKCGPFSR